MRMHTIEGEAMLKRVGGLLGDVGTRRSFVPRALGRQRLSRRARRRGDPDRCAHRLRRGRAQRDDDAPAYRAARSLEEALAELETCAGTQFDPRVVAAVVTVARRWSPPAPTAVRDSNCHAGT